MRKFYKVKTYGGWYEIWSYDQEKEIARVIDECDTGIDLKNLKLSEIEDDSSWEKFPFIPYEKIEDLIGIDKNEPDSTEIIEELLVPNFR